ncbi:hypothetical protein EVAR_40076_1 [Eumeta japonica]|uniref:Uncharacterized protein n=1 Tax=Eumeta variegata TaxID=151549 RepID=A0A4C1X1C9_EUMVA|nr:hypothetical protein EVAR_40076_1 [Eumeta japonica]
MEETPNLELSSCRTRSPSDGLREIHSRRSGLSEMLAMYIRSVTLRKPFSIVRAIVASYLSILLALRHIVLVTNAFKLHPSPG